MPEPWAKPKDADVLEAVREAVEDLDDLQNEAVSADPSYTTGDRAMHVDYWGTRGATRKRQAEIEFLTGAGNWRLTLRAAQADYEQGLQAGYVVDHWILGQFVVLRAVLASAAGVPQGTPDRRWDDTCRAVRQGIDSGNPYEQMWAWSSLADLRLVALRENWPLEIEQSTSVLGDLEAMVRAVGGPERCAALWPTFRQFWRWRTWWKDPAWQVAAEQGFEYLWALVRPALDIPPPTVAAPPKGDR